MSHDRNPTFTYYVTPQIPVVTTVSSVNGGTLNQASIAIYSGTTNSDAVWTGAVNQSSPVVQYGTLTLGDTTLNPGSFTLVIPSGPQPGSVSMQGTMTSAGNTTTIQAQVAQWNASSGAMAGAGA